MHFIFVNLPIGIFTGKLSAKIGHHTKSVEYRLLIKRGTHARGTDAKRRINNQFLITGFSITSDFITQSKLLGGSTPQTPRWGRKRRPQTPRALAFRWDAYTRLFIHL